MRCAVPKKGPFKTREESLPWLPSYFFTLFGPSDKEDSDRVLFLNPRYLLGGRGVVALTIEIAPFISPILVARQE